MTIYSAVSAENIANRVSLTNLQARCTPVNFNGAVRSRNAFSQNGWAILGDIGNRNIQGMYTTKNLVQEGQNPTIHSPTFDADFWRDYIRNEELIEMNAVSNLKNNSDYYPPSEVFCANGTLGCENHCLKTYACTLREQQGKECLVIVARRSRTTPAYRPALIANLGIPAYMCFIGRVKLQEYALHRLMQKQAVIFYLEYPDEFFARYPNNFKRISLPLGTADEVNQDTQIFGENGYGQPSANPVHVAPFDDENQKVASNNVVTESANKPILNVFSRVRLVDERLATLIDTFINLTNDSSVPIPDDPYFTASCSWVRSNYEVWAEWMKEPLPLCTVQGFMEYSIAGCDNNSTFREVTFNWQFPDPSNSSKPYLCDGGMLDLPAPLNTSRSCQWLRANTETWLAWPAAKPACDNSFYSFEVEECDANSKHQVKFVWLLPDSSNGSVSQECDGDLPVSFQIDCEYVPVTSGTYVGILVVVLILASAIVVLMVMVFRHRNMPIIRRSQYEFLESMLVGTLCICAAILLYGGKPTFTLCAARPISISAGFTLVFGSLVVKSLRVYRIFMSKGMKRVVLTARTMGKVLASFLLIDAAIITAWFVVDTPGANHVSKTIDEISPHATFSMLACASSHFIFSALLMFWKAILLGTGLYLSFLVRKVSVDFQESIWIFSSSFVVALACLLLLPLAYLVSLPATTFYIFFAGVLWISTFMAVSLMFVPKFVRHKEVASTSSAGSMASSESNPDSRLSETGAIKLTSVREQAQHGPTMSHTSPRVVPAKRSRSNKNKRGDASSNLDTHGVVPADVVLSKNQPKDTNAL